MPYCDECGTQTNAKRELREITFSVSGNPVTFQAEQLVCEGCNGVVYNEELDTEVMRRFTLEYQLKYGMSANEILHVREQYQLDGQAISQRLFAQVLNISKNTIQKHEAGQVNPSKAQLQVYADLLSAPEMIVHHFKLQERYMKESDREKVRTILRPHLEQQHSDAQWLTDHYAPYRITEYSGYVPLRFDKLKELVRYFTRSGLSEEELGFRLWLADTRYFQKQTTGITGLVYTRTYQLPAPLDYRLLLAHLEHAKVIRFDQAGMYSSTPIMYADAPYNRNLLDEEEWTLVQQIEQELMYTKLSDLVEELDRYVPARWMAGDVSEAMSYKAADPRSGRSENSPPVSTRSSNNLCYVNPLTGALHMQTSDDVSGMDYSVWMQIPFYEYVKLASVEQTSGVGSKAYQELLYSICQDQSEDA